MRRCYFVAFLSLFLGSNPVHGQTPTSTPTVSNTPDQTATLTPTPTTMPTLTATPTRRPAVPLDFDGDGVSDVGVFEDQGDGSKNEFRFAFVYSSDGTTDAVEHGNSEDYPALGDYNGDGIPDITIVKEQDEGLVWIVRDGVTGEKTSHLFGNLDETILAGCDFDGDEITDKAVVGSTALRYESSVSAEVVEVPLTFAFGTILQSLSCGDLNGDRVPELVMLVKVKAQAAVSNKLSQKRKKRRKKRKKRTPTPTPSAYEQYVRAVDLSGEALISREVSNAAGMFVADLNNDQVNEIATHKKLSKGVMRLSFFSLDTDEPVSLDVTAFDDISPAKFKASDGNIYDGVLILTKSEEVLRLNFRDLVEEEPIVIEQEEREALLHAVISHATGSNVPEDPEHLCSTVERASDGNGGFLWKQSDFHPGLVVVFPGEFRPQFSEVKVMKDGEILAGLYFAGYANPDEFGLRQHWRDTTPACSFPDKSIVIATRGSTRYCWQIGDSCDRND